MQPLICYLLVLQVAEFCINWSRTSSFAAHIKKKIKKQRFPGALWLFRIFQEICKKSPAMYSLKMQAAGYINVWTVIKIVLVSVFKFNYQYLESLQTIFVFQYVLKMFSA